MEEIQKKAHYIAVTGIIRNSEGKYLICKRGPNEKAFPNKWCVPGGKLEKGDFVNQPKDTSDHWLNVFEKTLHWFENKKYGVCFQSGVHKAKWIFNTDYKPVCRA